ncbi:MAG: response regulator [Lachnospiraceae bacterium]|nr:response regulator [Lachnospiraceae bacterium]
MISTAYAQMALLCGVVLTIILWDTIKITNKSASKRNYIYVLSFSIAFCLVDGIWSMVASTRWDFGKVVLAILTYLVYVLSSAAAFGAILFALRILGEGREWHKKLVYIVAYLLFAVQVILLIFNIFNESLFTVSSSINYTVIQPARILFFAMQGIEYFMIATVAIMKLFMGNKKEQYRAKPMILFGLIPSAFAFAQAYVVNVSLLTAGFAFACLAVYSQMITTEQTMEFTKELDNLRIEGKNYRKALLLRAECSYFADVTSDTIDEAPMFRSDDMVLGRTPIEYPCSMTDYLDSWSKNNNIVPIDPKFDIKSTYPAKLIEAFERGINTVEFEFSLGDGNSFRRKTVLLEKNSEGHVIATTIISSIDDIRAAELAALKKEREMKDLYDSLSNIYRTMYHLDLVTKKAKLLKASVDANGSFPQETDLGNIEVHNSNNVIEESQRQAYLEYINIDTLPERMKDTNILSMECKSKENGWLQISFVAYKRNDWGELTEALWTTMLIDDRKKHELEVATSLENAYIKVKEANAAKLDFLFRMGHDIRTPLNGIAGLSRIALENGSDSERVEYCLKTINSTSNHILKVIQDILDLSKIESGKVVVSREVTNLSDISENCIAALDSYIGTRDIKKEITYQDAGNCYVYTDLVKMRQAIINVISNAVKFTPDGGKICLHFENEMIDDSHCSFRIVVKDNGAGMDVDFLRSIYEPFKRNGGNSLANGGNDNNGLGMAIVKDLMDLLGGHIKIESEKNVGTTVTLIFPVTIAKSPYSSNKEEESEELPVDLKYFKGMKILVAEDNELNRDVAANLFEECNFNVVSATDGSEAVDKFMQSEVGSIDVILMDIVMPNMNGFEATKIIRESGRADAKTVQIIALTGKLSDTDAEESKKVGMDAYLSKPIDITKILSLIYKKQHE